MAAAIGYALRRTSARVVLAVGTSGLFWMLAVAQPYRPPGQVQSYWIPFLALNDPYHIVGSGISSWLVAAAALVGVVAVVAGAVLWRGRAIAR